jgi:non-heme chloroperoxidase
VTASRSALERHSNHFEKQESLMRLEILHHAPSKKRSATPLLFVHGAYTNASCWSENFLPYFAEQGWDTYAVSLRGHGKSEGYAHLLTTLIEDYLLDLESAVSELPAPPILIGHSMGGFLIQRYLETRTAPAAVLLSSTPPTGLLPIFFHLLWSRPFMLQQLSFWQDQPEKAPVEFWRNLIFSHRVPSSDLEQYRTLYQRESLFATLQLYGQFVRSLASPVPVLVMAGKQDGMVPNHLQWLTALFYGTRPEFLDGCHAMMLDPNWRAFASRIDEWLQESGIH